MIIRSHRICKNKIRVASMFRIAVYVHFEFCLFRTTSSVQWWFHDWGAAFGDPAIRIWLSGLLHLSTLDFWGWIIFCCGSVLSIEGCLQYFWLDPLDASSNSHTLPSPTPTVVTESPGEGNMEAPSTENHRTNGKLICGNI